MTDQDATKSFMSLMDGVVTRHDASEVVYRIDSALSSIHNNSLRLALDSRIEVGLKSADISLRSLSSVQTWLRAAREFMITLPVVYLTVAIMPSLGLTEKLHQKAMRSFGRPLVLDVDVDRSVIGGALIGYNGKQFDYSLATQFDSYAP